MSYKGRQMKFGRKKSQRVALLTSLCRSLIIHERIQTTETKAKAVRPIIEKMITRAREDTLANRRHLLSKFNNENRLIKKLFEKLAPRYKGRNGGYTRIIKLEARTGSGRTCAIIEFV